MYSPKQILEWIETNVQRMRRSRQKTLADIVAAGMEMRGCGVLALGRALPGQTTPKHKIKRVWRFFRNEDIEIEAIQEALIRALAPAQGLIVLLADWTDLGQYKILVVSLPRDGRALPIWWKTIDKHVGEGSMIAVETEVFAALEKMLPVGREILMVADRGFGNTRWIGECIKRGWGYVQRLGAHLVIDSTEYLGKLGELGILPGTSVHDHGAVLMSDSNPLTTRLVTTYAKDAKEPWYLVTSSTALPTQIVRLYQRRMWIEEMFRDLKNRRWGLGMEHVELSQPVRHDRHLAVLALTYVFLCAFGAAAETEEIADQLKANTESNRAMALARIGNYFIQIASLSIVAALSILNTLPP
jgi:hypothetical protein